MNNLLQNLIPSQNTANACPKRTPAGQGVLDGVKAKNRRSRPKTVRFIWFAPCLAFLADQRSQSESV
jgi:hypothetical protein